MNKKKSIILGGGHSKFLQSLSSNEELAKLLEFSKEVGVSEEIKSKDLFNQHDFCFLGGEYCLDSINYVQRRSVESHFLQYIDLVVKESDQLWGYSIFPLAFNEVLLKSIQNQDFKGSVIFLGHSPLALPVIDVLSRFGFQDFVFLDLNKGDQNKLLVQNSAKGLLGVQFSSVDSTAFIRSQKEYSFCFVMEKTYSKQTLEDMSYFHFLSTHSIVFDLVGESNFLFEDVRALGVSVTEFKFIQQIWINKIVQNIANIAVKMS